MLTTRFLAGSFSGVLFSLFLPGVVFAQGPGWKVQASPAFEHQFSAETKDGGAERERDTVSFSTEIASGLGQGRRSMSSIKYLRTEDDWTGSFLSGGISPYDGIEAVSLGLAYQQPIEGAWGVFGRGRMDWAIARFDDSREERSWSDGMSGSIAAGASYLFSPELSVSAGVFYVDRLGDDPLVIPIVFVRWQINDHWTLRTANGVFLTYDVAANQQHLLTGSVTYESTDFAHSRADIPETVSSSLETVYGEEESVRARLHYLLNFSPRWGVHVSVAYDFARDIELRSSHQRVAKADLDGALSVGVALTARF